MFVSRTAYNVVLESRDVAYRALERVQRELDRERERTEKQVDYNRALVQTIVEMRRERDGSFTPRPTMAEPMESSPLDDAIAERSKGNPALRRHLLRYRDSMRAQKKEDAEILDTLSNWRDPEPDE